MELAERFQEKGFNVCSVFQEPEADSWKIYIEKPKEAMLAVEIVEIVQEMDYHVTVFDNRCPKYVCIYFKAGTGPQPNQFTFYGVERKICSTPRFPDKQILFGKLRQHKVEFDEKEIKIKIEREDVKQPPTKKSKV